MRKKAVREKTGRNLAMSSSLVEKVFPSSKLVGPVIR